jgi:polyphosphate kinase|tara:strand:+ start:22452 stop:24503 length:2052 start_codon:yes stop_codon:yes gene_type:complete
MSIIKFKNRELSWLDFNERVLQEAEDKSVPLIDRLRFIGIFSNNLDEFYKIRYATVKRIALSNQKEKKVYKGESAKDLLSKITKNAIKLQQKSTIIFNSILKDLEKENILMINEKNIPKESLEYLNEFYQNKVFPQLKIVILNEKDNFPQLTDFSSFLIVSIKSKNNKFFYALIQFPSEINRFIVLKNKLHKNILLIDDLIRYNLNQIFKIFDPISVTANMIKFSRDAELDFDDDISKSYLEKISQSVKDRLNGEPVRFIYDKEINPKTLNFLLDKMNINSETDSIIHGGRYHNKRDYMKFPGLNQNLVYKNIIPLNIPGFMKNKSIFKILNDKDFLQHTPYHNFNHILNFLSEASIDPDVKKISITIYRLSKLSSVANTLINAAKSGKKVVVQIELQARFDENANIDYAKLMQDQGVKLIFGIPNLKVHAKICVVEKKIDNKIKKYGFVSTGNFNESTAKIYTDFTLFTSNKEILNDISKVFDFFKFNYKKFKFNHLILSPYRTQTHFTDLINDEIENAKKGKNAFIKIKLNNITSYSMIEELYKASRSGVKIKMIVRGICCLLPNRKNLSENIQVISIIDKFLEHTRMFIFCNDGDNKTFISSADWMTRNLENRVEVTCPVLDRNISKRINGIFDIYWEDNIKSRLVNSSNNNDYKKNNKSKLRSQEEVYNFHLKNLEKES